MDSDDATPTIVVLSFLLVHTHCCRSGLWRFHNPRSLAAIVSTQTTGPCSRSPKPSIATKVGGFLTPRRNCHISSPPFFSLASSMFSLNHRVSSNEHHCPGHTNDRPFDPFSQLGQWFRITDLARRIFMHQGTPNDSPTSRCDSSTPHMDFPLHSPDDCAAHRRFQRLSIPLFSTISTASKLKFRPEDRRGISFRRAVRLSPPHEGFASGPNSENRFYGAIPLSVFSPIPVFFHIAKFELGARKRRLFVAPKLKF